MFAPPIQNCFRRAWLHVKSLGNSGIFKANNSFKLTSGIDIYIDVCGKFFTIMRMGATEEPRVGGYCILDNQFTDLIPRK